MNMQLPLFVRVEMVYFKALGFFLFHVLIGRKFSFWTKENCDSAAYATQHIRISPLNRYHCNINTVFASVITWLPHTRSL